MDKRHILKATEAVTHITVVECSDFGLRIEKDGRQTQSINSKFPQPEKYEQMFNEAVGNIRADMQRQYGEVEG